MITKYDPVTHTWRAETKEECLQKEDIEGKRPCDKCWKLARDGVFVWPLKDYSKVKRCKSCGRIIG
jgi:hypothetical protein